MGPCALSRCSRGLRALSHFQVGVGGVQHPNCCVVQGSPVLPTPPAFSSVSVCLCVSQHTSARTSAAPPVLCPQVFPSIPPLLILTWSGGRNLALIIYHIFAFCWTPVDQESSFQIANQNSWEKYVYSSSTVSVCNPSGLRPSSAWLKHCCSPTSLSVRFCCAFGIR